MTYLPSVRQSSWCNVKALIYIPIVVLPLLISCQSSHDYPGEKTEMDLVTTETGLRYIDMLVGDGSKPSQGDVVTVHYSGYLMDGKKFDSSVDRDEPLVFRLGVGAVIKGWDEGIATMKIGGKRKLVIPSHLGYGERGVVGLIPPNADLVFDVELLGSK